MKNTKHIQENYKLSTIKRLEELFGYTNEQEMNDDMDLTHTLIFLQEQNLQVQEALFRVLETKKKHENPKFEDFIVDEMKERKIFKLIDKIEELLREFDSESGEKQEVALQIISQAAIWGSQNTYEGIGMLEEAKFRYREVVLDGLN